MKRWTFVVDTEEDAGGFERELCGYLTGRLEQDCGPNAHGSKEAAIAEKELPAETWKYFEDHVINCLEEPDDLPIHTPVVGYPTPGWWNNGRGVMKKGAPTEEDLKKCYQEKPWPCYRSVGIFFDERPPENIIKLLKERTGGFSEKYWPSREFGGKVPVTGFRLLEENYGEPQVLKSMDL
jgi:hypothetical protein